MKRLAEAFRNLPSKVRRSLEYRLSPASRHNSYGDFMTGLDLIGREGKIASRSGDILDCARFPMRRPSTRTQKMKFHIRLSTIGFQGKILGTHYGCREKHIQPRPAS